MHKFSRTVLLTGLVAVGLAGCGDDVTVVQPPPPPPPPAPTVKSISVAPNPGNVAIGGTITMSAAVIADEGVATTVTWSSSDAAKATVNPTSGVVTGVSTGSVAITATSTVAPTVSGNATVNVTAAPAVATISIASVNTAGGAPVLLANVAGQINVVLNLERGGETVTGIDLLLCGKVVGSQNFGAPMAADGDVQAAVEQITIPVNTAAFDPITGAVLHCLNGPTELSARVRTAQNLEGTASPTINLTLNNISFFAVTVTVENGSTATNAAGLLWETGDVRATAVQVNYTTATPTTQQVVFSDNGGTLVTKTVTSAPWTATWLKANGIPNNQGAGSFGLADGTFIINAVSTVNNQPGPNGSSAPLRVDNQPPAVGVLTLTAQGAFNCCVDNWIGKAYAFPIGHGIGTGAAGTAPNDGAGVGLLSPAASSITYHVGPAITSTLNPSQTALAAFVAANPDPIANGAAVGTETIDNTERSVVAKIVDRLGNTSYVALGQGVNLGVGFDLGDPTFDGEVGVENGDINQWAGVLAYQSSNSDNLSGFGPMPIRRRLFANFTNSGQANCWGTIAGSGACNFASDDNLTSVDLFAGTVDAVAVPGGTTLGERYMTFEGFTRDKAGNVSPTVMITALEDYTNPVSSNIGFPGTLTGGANASFTATLTDNVDLASFQFRIGYGGGTMYVPFGNETVIGSFGSPRLTSHSATALIPFMRGIEPTNGAGTPAGATNNADEAWMQVFDVAGNFSTQSNNIAGGTYTAIVAGDLAAARNVATFVISQSADLCEDVCGGGSAPSVTLTATATMTNNTANNPFPRGVDFHLINTSVAPTFPIRLGQATSFSVTSQGGVNVYRWTISLPNSRIDDFGDNYDIAALGASSTGVGLLNSQALVLVP